MKIGVASAPIALDTAEDATYQADALAGIFKTVRFFAFSNADLLLFSYCCTEVGVLFNSIALFDVFNIIISLPDFKSKAENNRESAENMIALLIFLSKRGIIIPIITF